MLSKAAAAAPGSLAHPACEVASYCCRSVDNGIAKPVRKLSTYLTGLGILNARLCCVVTHILLLYDDLRQG